MNFPTTKIQKAVPLFFKKQILHHIVAVWHVTEQEDFFVPKLPLSPTENTEFSLLKGKKRIEWLASRYLLHLLLEKEERIFWEKDEFGKPFLPDNTIFFNISHSGEMVAAIVAEQPVGIDIQIFAPKMARIAHKFMSEKELSALPNEHLLDFLHLYWAAKEALYKAYGRRELDFKKHIFLNLDLKNPYNTVFYGNIQKNDSQFNYQLWCEKVSEDYFLVVCAPEKSMSQISIVMPVFNAAPYLAECLYSIIQQTETDWELLAVNDFSTDETPQILQDFAEKDTRIKIFNNINKGIIGALNTAFSHAKGSFLTRMDADDRMFPEKLALLKKALLEKGHRHIAVGEVHYFSDNELGNGFLRYADWLNNLTKNANNYTEIYRECVIPSPCWMVFREDFERCGGFLSDIYPEDYDLCFRFYQSGLKIAPVSEVVHAWRDHATRASRTDANYADNSFFDIKIAYFLQLHYQKNRTLILWGAGKKGKTIAKKLIEKAVSFRWICENLEKIGKNIYDIRIENTTILHLIQEKQLIVAISSPNEQREIEGRLQEMGLKSLVDYYFFV
jgi:glycosyltransferase involved in cell wall biosynthesis/phosphopantetheinyl transferase